MLLRHNVSARAPGQIVSYRHSCGTCCISSVLLCPLHLSRTAWHPSIYEGRTLAGKLSFPINPILFWSLDDIPFLFLCSLPISASLRRWSIPLSTILTSIRRWTTLQLDRPRRFPPSSLTTCSHISVNEQRNCICRYSWFKRWQRVNRQQNHHITATKMKSRLRTD